MINDAYTALMMAADKIEIEPHVYRFTTMTLPQIDKCGTVGCAIGWVLAFMGYKPDIEGFWTDEQVMEALGGDGVFYKRMDGLAKRQNWMSHHEICATALRAYAHKYHAPEKSVG